MSPVYTSPYFGSPMYRLEMLSRDLESTRYQEQSLCIGAEMRYSQYLEYDQVFSSRFPLCALMQYYSLASSIFCSEVVCIMTIKVTCNINMEETEGEGR